MSIAPGDERMLGGEASGVILRVGAQVMRYEVGDKVLSFSRGTFANRLVTNASRTHHIPCNMSFTEAATLAAVYLTSIHSLMNTAGLRKGDRVLIHSAAGGVDIAAIQLSQYIGAEIFATVGTDEKRNFLQNTFGIQNDHIYNSRDADFAEQIMAITENRGVDVVLKSLTGDMLDASFRILADGGTMVKLGKRDIQERHSLPMAPFEKNTSYCAVDMSHERTPDDMVARYAVNQNAKSMRLTLTSRNGPVHVFSVDKASSALRFLRAGKHTGKVVLSYSDRSVPLHTMLCNLKTLKSPKLMTFCNNASHLIVGGLRGLCGSATVYLARSGARHLSVICRSGYEDSKSQAIIQQVQATGAHLDLFVADITVFADVTAVFKKTAKPIAGIIQGAMVLRARPFEAMTIDEYHDVLKCKVQGTWNLHQAAENAGINLDFFTVLSSISGYIGNRGQSNYAAGNAFLDAFASFRTSRHQAACSIDLGIVEDDGYLANHSGFIKRHFDTDSFQGINNALLQSIIHTSIVQQAEAEPKYVQIITGISPKQNSGSPLARDARFAALFSENGKESAGGGSKSTHRSSDSAQALLSKLHNSSSDRKSLLICALEVMNHNLMRMLRLAEPMDTSRPLSVYGIDSLAAVEIRNWLRTDLGIQLTTLDIMNAPSLTALCDKLITQWVNMNSALERV